MKQDVALWRASSNKAVISPALLPQSSLSRKKRNSVLRQSGQTEDRGGQFHCRQCIVQASTSPPSGMSAHCVPTVQDTPQQKTPRADQRLPADRWNKRRLMPGAQELWSWVGFCFPMKPLSFPLSGGLPESLYRVLSVDIPGHS